MRTLLVLALLVAVAEGKDDKAELKKFEGTWQLVSEVMDGKEQPADYVRPRPKELDVLEVWVRSARAC